MAGRQDVFQRAMNQGHSAAWDQMWDQAAGFYRQALDEFPDHPQALTNLGLALIELQDYDAALHCYERAAKIMSADPLPLEKIAQLYERMGNLDRASLASLRAADLYMKNREAGKAIENWQRVIRLNPENLQAHSRLAVIYERMNEKQQSVKEYLSVASVLQSAGDLDRALRSVKQALTLAPQDEEALQALAMLRDFKSLPRPERPRGATAPLRMAQVRQLRTPQDLTPADAQIHPVDAACQAALTVMAGMLFESPDEDVQVKRQGLQAIVVGAGLAHKSADRARIVLHLSQVVDLQTRAELSQAAEELQRALDAGLEHPAVDFDLGYLYMQSGRVETALRLLQRAVKHEDFALAARLLLGELLRKRGQLKEATVHYLEALRLADAQMVAPEVSIELRQLYDPLIETLQQRDFKTLDSLCDNIQTMLMQADWRQRLAQARSQIIDRGYGVVRPVVEILTEAQSNQLIDTMAKIQHYREQGYIRSAMDEAFYALEIAPAYLPLHRLIGQLLIDQGNIPAAVTKLQAVAKSYTTRGESQQAIALYRSMVDLSPTDFHIRSRLIEQLTAAGQTENAVHEHMRLAEVYYRQADFRTARKIYTDALRATQQTNIDRNIRVKILHSMADIDLQSLDWRQALRVFEQIRILQPEDEKARLRLVELNLRLNQEKQALVELDQYLSYLNGVNQQETALKFLENLASENPKRVPIRRRLADLYRHLGKKKDALAELDAIGELLMSAGDRAGAIQIIESLLALEPANKNDYLLLLQQIRSGSK